MDEKKKVTQVAALTMAIEAVENEDVKETLRGMLKAREIDENELKHRAELDEKVLKAIAENPKSTVKALAEKIGKTTYQAVVVSIKRLGDKVRFEFLPNGTKVYFLAE